MLNGHLSSIEGVEKLSSKRKEGEERVVFGPDIETTGLDPFTCKILTIQLRKEGCNHIWAEWRDGGEADIIQKFLDFWETIPRSKKRGGYTFVAYNVLHFDIPFIVERSRILGLNNLEFLWDSLVRYPVYLDLYQLLGDSLMKFARWKGLLIGKADEWSGKDVPKFYKKKEFSKIIEYVNDELESFERIYEAIRKEPFYKQLRNLRLKADARG